MMLEFDLKQTTVTEFGIGRDDADGESFAIVPVDAPTQAALREMAAATHEAMLGTGDPPSKYEPADKHGAVAYLYLPLADDLAQSIRRLHEAENLDIDTRALLEPDSMFCYFARFSDGSGRRLTGLRRAAQFKGVLKSRNRLVRMVDDTLKVIEDTVFKLDMDFDLLVDESRIHILRPKGFEFAGRLREAILDAVPANVKVIQDNLGFVDLGPIGAYAASRPRAARYLASIRTQDATRNIDQTLLLDFCQQTGVDLEQSDGKLRVVGGHEMGFLEVLDRRRYEVTLVKAAPERYRAASRRKI